MNCLSKLQKVLLCAGLVLIVAALFGAPKYWDYCEMQEMKEEFERFVDVENWPEDMEIRMGSHTLNETETARVKGAIAKLEFSGKFDEQDYYDNMFMGTGMVGSLHILILNKDGPGSWSVDVGENGVYCYESRHGYAMKNSGELYRVLEELQVKYPD